MKLERPPQGEEFNYSKYLSYIDNDPVMTFLHESDARYFYWSELKYRPNLPLEDSKEVWELIKINRILRSRNIYFASHAFSFNLTSFIQKDLHDFDLKLIGGLYQDAITPEDQDEYFTHSLMEEAIASSQIEGADTTTDIAREMIKSGRKPRTESEQMIFNNFKAIQAIEERLHEQLTDQLILDIHEIMTSNTDAARYSGSFRTGPIYVKDYVNGEIAHVAPPHEQVAELIESLNKFINDDDEFIHPIVKASILHFIVGYIHPFGDGNGRTARALFYWYLMKKGYNVIKHISISRAILASRTSYDKAFLKTEYDGNDLTYFILYSIKSLRVAFQSLIKYRDRKREERHKASEIVYELLKVNLNKRQADLLGYLYLKPDQKVTIPQYSERHNIVRQTASRDLFHLVNRGLLHYYKDGRNGVFGLTNKSAVAKLLTAIH